MVASVFQPNHVSIIEMHISENVNAASLPAEPGVSLSANYLEFNQMKSKCP